MSKHTLQLQVHHLMYVTICGLCLWVAARPGRELFYVPAALLAPVVLGTLKDYVVQMLSDLNKH